MLDKILRFFHRLAQAVDRRSARPTPIRPVCYACREPIIGPGYMYRGRRFCDSLCIPPFLLGGLAGDPR